MQQPQPIVNPEDFEALTKRGLNVRPLLRTFRRKALLIAGVVTAMAGFASFQAAGEPPSYQGNFRILVEPVTNEARITDPLSLTRDDGGVPTGVFGLDYPTQLQILRSEGILNEIVEEIQKKYPNFTLRTLTEKLSVARIGSNRLDQTRIIEVYYSGSDPDLVQLVLEETSGRFLRYSLEERKTRFSQGIQFIEEQLPVLQERVNSLQNQLQFIQQRYELIDPVLQGESLSTQFTEINNLQLETERQLREQQALYGTLQQQLQLTPEEAIAASALSEDPGYQTLLASLQTIESEIAAESVRFSEQSPVIQALRQEQNNLYGLLDQQAERVLGQNLPDGAGNQQVLGFQNSVRINLINQLVNTTNQIQVLEERRQEILRAQVESEQRVQQFPAIARQYNDLQRQLDIATRTLDQLLTQRENLRVESAQTDVPWELVSAPLVPVDAEGKAIPLPQSKKGLILAILASSVLGMGAAILLEKLQNVFFSTEDIQDDIELPLLGVIPYSQAAPYLPESQLSLANLDEKVKSRPSMFPEAFTSLYARIALMSSEAVGQSIAVCSAAPGDGKTTVASNLAQAVAGMGQRVLLVDANLRDPQLHHRFDVLHMKGLSDLLVNQSLAIQEVIQPSSETANLSIITAGQPNMGSPRLLASARMTTLMQEFQAAYDLVIYDTPHYLGLADASFLATQVNTVLMVIGIGKTGRSETVQVLEELRAFHPEGLGIVSNHLKEHFGSTFGYHSPRLESKRWSRVKLPKPQLPTVEEHV